MLQCADSLWSIFLSARVVEIVGVRHRDGHAAERKLTLAYILAACTARTRGECAFARVAPLASAYILLGAARASLSFALLHSFKEIPAEIGGVAEIASLIMSRKENATSRIVFSQSQGSF
eukprot:1307410-Pleurochrysis_carterae.AAC.2